MKIWGKLLGFLFGFMLSKNILGALIGMFIGHNFDKGRSFDFSHLANSKGAESKRQAAFFYTTFSVMGYIAKANGLVSKHEIQFASAYMDKLSLQGELRQQAQDAFSEGKSSDFSLKDRLRKFKTACGNRHDLLSLFLEIQIQVAFADGILDNEERQALHTIAEQLGFSAKELDQLLEMMIAGAQFHQGQGTQQSSQSQLESAYKVLGVSPDTSEKDIKNTYRKLMSQHHPDKLVAKGLPPEMMEMAKQKTQDIQAAYEVITKNK
ncbi:MAG: co-chaperone DjlA [Colwellia sp.]|nr:co-chaperone DjlA [Colwellia sp.]